MARIVRQKREPVVMVRRKPKPKVREEKKQPEPAQVAEKKKRKKRKSIPSEFYQQVAGELKTMLPDKLPYKTHIHKDILHRLHDQYPGQQLLLRRTVSAYLYSRCEKRKYLEAIVEGQCRHGLDGETYPIEPGAVVAAKEKIAAKDKWKAYWAKKRGKNGERQDLKRPPRPIHGAD